MADRLSNVDGYGNNPSLITSLSQTLKVFEGHLYVKKMSTSFF
jgi:hypothetical protein